MDIIGYLRIVKAFWIFIGERMINEYWLVSVFVIKYALMIVKSFKIFMGKRIVNDYWILYVFGIVSAFRM